MPVYSENSPILAAKIRSGTFYIKLKIKWRTGLKTPYKLKLKSLAVKNFEIKKHLQSLEASKKMLSQCVLNEPL